MREACLAVVMGVLILASVSATTFAVADSATFEEWDFTPSGEILGIATIQDLTRDRVDDLIVAAHDKSIYAIEGVSGLQIWNYTAGDYLSWKALVTKPEIDVNNNSKPDVLAATTERSVIMIDGAKGKKLWSLNTTDSSYIQGSACSMSLRSAHLVSDIDRDGILDVVLISGTGDNCAQKDRISVLALSSKTGKELWEYAKAEDYHGLKDGIELASPVAILDFNRDGALDVAFADEQSFLRVINGLDGNEMRRTELTVFGSIWDFTMIPDVSGDGVPDALAFEFIEAGGGPDYASIDAIDLIGSSVLWQVKVGDGRINGAALYSAASLNGTSTTGGGLVPQVAVTMRTENELTLALLDAKTGVQKWQYRLGEERSRDDLSKIYPVARIATAGARDELAVGSIDSKLYLLNPIDGSVIWSHGVTGEIGSMAYVAAPGGKKYVIVEDSYLGLRALSRQTTIDTSLSISSSAQTVVSSSKIVVSGTLDPPFPGELIEIRYVDPAGSVVTKSLVLSREGTYEDIIEPVMTGTWKVSASFKGEGFYVDSKSQTLEFNVLSETKTLVYQLKVPDDQFVSYPISYFVDKGQVNAMTVNKETKTLKIDIAPSADGSLMVELPRSVIDSFESRYQVYVDGKAAQYQEIEADTTKRTLTIPFEQDAREITISGTYIVPEFALAPLVLGVAMASGIAIVGLRSRLR